MTDEELDELLRKAVQARMEDCDPPPVEEAWKRFKARLRRYEAERRKVRIGPWRLPRLALAAALLFALLIAIPITFPDQLGAIGRRVFHTTRTVVDLGDGEMNLMAGRHPQDQAPPSPPPPGLGPEGGTALDPEVKEIPMPPEQKGLSLEEVRSAAPFMVRAPRYLPAGYTRKDITYQPHPGGTSGRVEMFYEGPDGGHLRFEQFNITGGFGMGRGFDADDTEIREVRINGNSATLLIHKKQWCTLTWFDNEMFYELSGKIPPEEIQKVAASIR